jgi:hypothetical protein
MFLFKAVESTSAHLLTTRKSSSMDIAEVIRQLAPTMGTTGAGSMVSPAPSPIINAGTDPPRFL